MLVAGLAYGTGRHGRRGAGLGAGRVLVARHLVTQRPVGILMMDLDRLKQLNDALGHRAGDQLLQELAPRSFAAPTWPCTRPSALVEEA